jgi:hypothetical protein
MFLLGQILLEIARYILNLRVFAELAELHDTLDVD